MAEKQNMVYGIHPITESLESGKSFDKIFIRKGLTGNHINKIKQFVHTRKIPLQQVPIEKLNRITRKNHQGIIGLISPIDFQNIEDILPGLYEQGLNPFLVILDQISDIRNFGAIARTAEAAGVHAIIIPSKGSSQINSDAMKTSAGALNYIPICRTPNLYNTCKFLKDSGVKLAAATEKTDLIYHKETLSDPVGLIMGSEGKGVTKQILNLADAHLKIPLKGNIESLNVSVASGILIYEIVRQRTLKFKKI